MMYWNRVVENADKSNCQVMAWRLFVQGMAWTKCWVIANLTNFIDTQIKIQNSSFRKMRLKTCLRNNCIFFTGGWVKLMLMAKTNDEM